MIGSIHYWLVPPSEYKSTVMFGLGIAVFSSLLLFVVVCHASIKKGVAMGRRDMLCGDFKAFSNISWWYDWHSDLSYYCHDITSHAYNHVPMIWGWEPSYPVEVPVNAIAVLGFNEPNFHSQSNMTAREAAAHWPTIEQKSHGRPLVSPAAAPCSTHSKCYGDSFDWFDEFFRLCDGCRVDYVATHAYNCDANWTMDYLQKLYDRYGKKIWLTEFSCPHTMDYGKQLSYMKAILPRLEAADFVYRYSWYKGRKTSDDFTTHTTSLLHSHSSTLTTLGHYYNNFQWPQTSTQIVG